MKPHAGARRGRRLLARVASAPWAVHDALDIAFSLVKEGKPWLLGAIAYWSFDIATLWTCFHAFGLPPPAAVIVMAYFVGTLANSLPLPCGLGGVEAGMVGAFLAFVTLGSLAILAVLSYRLISFWLPTLPGAIAYLQLQSHRQHLERRHETTQAHNQLGASPLIRRRLRTSLPADPAARNHRPSLPIERPGPGRRPTRRRKRGAGCMRLTDERIRIIGPERSWAGRVKSTGSRT